MLDVTIIVPLKLDVKSVALEQELISTYGFATDEEDGAGEFLFGLVTAKATILGRVTVGHRRPVKEWITVEATAPSAEAALAAMWIRARQAAGI
jgi:hypothetical protein